ncbi:MAG: hypothetical protein AB8G15_06625 [Saprospiraceae bacterium]
MKQIENTRKMIKNVRFVFFLLIGISCFACQKKTVATRSSASTVSPQKIIKDFVEQKEMKVKSVFKRKEILAFDEAGKLLREIQLDQKNTYLIDISFAYDEQGRIKEEVLLGDLLERPLKKYQYSYQPNGERIVSRFHLNETTNEWKRQTGIGQLKPKGQEKEHRRSGFRFKKKGNETDLASLRAMTTNNRVSVKEVSLAQGILALVVYTDYSL